MNDKDIKSLEQKETKKSMEQVRSQLSPQARNYILKRASSIEGSLDGIKDIVAVLRYFSMRDASPVNYSSYQDVLCDINISFNEKIEDIKIEKDALIKIASPRPNKEQIEGE